jgi:hypothetical protein
VESKTCPRCGRNFVGASTFCPTCELYDSKEPRNKLRSITSIVGAVILISLCAALFFRDDTLFSIFPGNDANGKSNSPIESIVNSMVLVDGEKRGAEIWTGFLSRYADDLCYVTYIESSAPILTILLPEVQWRLLSEEDRFNFGLFIEKLPALMRDNPKFAFKAIPKSSDKPVLKRNFQNICDGCWTITLGHYSQENILIPDNVILCGDEAWHRLARFEGQRLSELRELAASQVDTEGQTPFQIESHKNFSKLSPREKKGAEIWGSFFSRYSDDLCYVTQIEGSAPILVISLPEFQWKFLSDEDRLDFGMFIARLPDLMREERRMKFKAIPKLSIQPIKSRNFNNICSDCWAVTIGHYSQENKLVPDHIVLTGSSALERDPKREGQSLSELQKLVTSSSRTK